MHRLNKTEMEELTKIMCVGNTALKQCAAMMDLTHREFRGKLFTNRLDVSKLTPDQLQQLNAAKPLIFAVRYKCADKMRLNFVDMLRKQAFLAARNNYDPNSAKEEFIQEGEMALQDAIYGYTDLSITMSTFVWQCVRNRIVQAINRLNPLCPLTNEALNLLRQVQDLQNATPTMTDNQAVEILGFNPQERDVFFSSITKVVHGDHIIQRIREEKHSDDYTAKRRGVDRDFKEMFFIRKDIRQAVKNANLNEFEFACLAGDTFSYHGWREDVASKHINPRTGERYTRANIEHVIARVKKKVLEVYLHPPEVQLENSLVDKFFDEWDAENAVEEDQQRK